MSSLLEIDLNKLISNYHIICDMLQGTPVGAAVKANAYGLGAAQVSEALINAGCKTLIVATIDEALHLRKQHPNIEIFMLHGITSPELAQEVAHHNIIPMLNSPYQIKIYQQQATKNDTKLPAILHFDTGLGRLGIIEDPNNIDYQNLTLKYIMSHLACAEEVENELNRLQLVRLLEISKTFPHIPLTIANSSGIFLGADYHLQLARPGYALYGGNPTTLPENPMHSVVKLQGYIIQKKILNKSQQVGYGATYQANKGDKILTIEYGYADGYLRSLFQRGYGVAYGKKLPLIGRVSMDMCNIDANQLTEQEFNEIKFVELLGDHITVDELGILAGTSGYEVLTCLSVRYKREYKN